MKGAIKYYLAALIISLSLSVCFMAPTAQGALISTNKANEINNNAWRIGQAGEIYSQNDSLEEKIGNVVKVVLGTLGTIFIILIVVSGYTWMTSGGNEEKVKKARANIKSSIIGLVVVLAAYAVSLFLASYFAGATLKVD